jgi:tRNA-intron endonuclease
MKRIVKKTVIRGRKKVIRGAVLSGDRVILHDPKLAAQLMTRSFGEQKKSQLYLNLYEACLLVEEKKLDVYDESGEKASLGDLMEDLRVARGYIVKSGIKFGSDFVVYPRGKNPANSHSKWMVHVMPESARIDYAEITRSARLAANVKKSMLFATVTERGPVYYEISRARL